MKPNIAVPSNMYIHILILSCLSTLVHTNTFYHETGLNLTLRLQVLCQNIHFKILRIFFFNPRNIHKSAFCYEFEVTQYNINWQKEINYQICIRANRKCVSCCTLFLPTLNFTEVIKSLIYNRSRENISLLTERKILKLQKLWREICSVTN